MPTYCDITCRTSRYQQTMGGKAASWVHDSRIIAEYRVPGYSDSCSTTGYCPKCGRRVGFAADGAPAVGERYDVLEAKLEEMERALVPLKRLWDAMTPFARAKALGDCEADPLAGLTYPLASTQE